MPVTNAYDGNTPTVGADADSWGGELNTALDQIETTLDNYATQINENETLSEGALQKAGGTMTGDQVLFSGGPTNARSSGYRGAPVVNFDANKTLALTDAGCTQRFFGSVERTMTIPPVGTVGFPIGTAIPIRNFATADLNIVGGSGVTLRVAGAEDDVDVTVSSFGLGTLLHEDTNLWVISGVGVS